MKIVFILLKDRIEFFQWKIQSVDITSENPVCIVDGFFWEFYINPIGLSGFLPFSEDKFLFFQYCQSIFNRHLAFAENFCQCFNRKVNEYMTICI